MLRAAYVSKETVICVLIQLFSPILVLMIVYVSSIVSTAPFDLIDVPIKLSLPSLLSRIYHLFYSISMLVY